MNCLFFVNSKGYRRNRTASFSIEAIDALNKCRVELQHEHPETVFDNRTILCLLPPIRLAKGSNIASVSQDVRLTNVVLNIDEA